MVIKFVILDEDRCWWEHLAVCQAALSETVGARDIDGVFSCVTYKLFRSAGGDRVFGLFLVEYVASSPFVLLEVLGMPRRSCGHAVN